MFKKAMLSAALLSVSLSASANWVLGVGYGNISDSEGDIDISLGGVIASAGYQYQINEHFGNVFSQEENHLFPFHRQFLLKYLHQSYFEVLHSEHQNFFQVIQKLYH